jgi:hypothetical protein
MAKTGTQKSLDKWTKQKWTTASGKPSTQGPKATGEVYAPKKKIAALKSTAKGKKKLAAANQAKRKATAAGKQHASHGLHKKAAKKKKKAVGKKK